MTHQLFHGYVLLLFAESSGPLAEPERSRHTAWSLKVTRYPPTGVTSRWRRSVNRERHFPKRGARHLLHVSDLPGHALPDNSADLHNISILKFHHRLREDEVTQISVSRVRGLLVHSCGSTTSQRSNSPPKYTVDTLIYIFFINYII